jgi:hypothetical protein
MTGLALAMDGVRMRAATPKTACRVISERKALG